MNGQPYIDDAGRVLLQRQPVANEEHGIIKQSLRKQFVVSLTPGDHYTRHRKVHIAWLDSIRAQSVPTTSGAHTLTLRASKARLVQPIAKINLPFWRE